MLFFAEIDNALASISPPVAWTIEPPAEVMLTEPFGSSISPVSTMSPPAAFMLSIVMMVPGELVMTCAGNEPGAATTTRPCNDPGFAAGSIPARCSE